MRWFKFITSALILGIIGLFVWQNLPTFKSSLPFSLDLYIQEPLSWTHAVYTILGIAALIGFFLGIGFMLKPYFKVRRLLAQERQEKQQLKQVDQPPAPATQEKPEETPS